MSTIIASELNGISVNLFVEFWSFAAEFGIRCLPGVQAELH
jgi:hypothetical protein